MRKTFILFALLVAFAFVAPHAWAQGPKLAYANLQKALNECDAGIKAKADLESEGKRLEEKLVDREGDIKKLKDEIESKKGVWNKATLEAKEKEYRGKVQDLQKASMQFSEELNRKRQAIESGIINDLRAVVEEIAKKKGLDFVFERSVGGILYAPQEADLTDEVIKTYNKQPKSKGGK